MSGWFFEPRFVVAWVEEVGPVVGDLAPGDQVVLNSWLSCPLRGAPVCQWCENGDFAQCQSFFSRRAGPSTHRAGWRPAGRGTAAQTPW